ncbi:MAG: glycosyltransferase family 2 protein [Pseudomonadales bacterium]|nr:glycosyltransferase family 2 protein [Pseudomonadales bacterium]
MTTIFWLSCTVIIYTYFGYPLLIWLLAKRFVTNDLSEAQLSEPRDWPSITILTPVHNDLDKAKKKIENLMELDYPKDKLTIMMISDGSTDGSDKYLGNDSRIRFIGYSPRQGKPTALNTGVKDIESDIVVFTDVRQQVKSDAVKRLVFRLLEPGIGAVSGELVLLDPETNTGAHVSLYWQYEKFIRIAESKVASVAGVTGALYAIRTKDYTPLAPDTLLDDFEVPIEIIKKGDRCILEPGAIIYDYPQEDTASEKVRKIRTLTGNFQSFFRHPWVFSPRENPIWLQFISHKFLRLVVPYFLMLTLISSAFSDGPFYLLAFWGQVGFYSLALLTNIIPALKNNRIASLANVFTELNWAAVLALKNYLSQEVNVKWDKTS